MKVCADGAARVVPARVRHERLGVRGELEVHEDVVAPQVPEEAAPHPLVNLGPVEALRKPDHEDRGAGEDDNVLVTDMGILVNHAYTLLECRRDLCGEGVDLLQRTISDRMTRGAKIYGLRIPVSDGAALAWLHEHGEVLSTKVEGEETRADVRLSDAAFARFTKRGEG